MEEAAPPAFKEIQEFSSSQTPSAASPADSSASLRRSARPKPSPQSLRSSPPAIKFYESTKLPLPKKPKLVGEATVASSLKLRLPQQRSPSPKARVVKLMMPQVETLPESPMPRALPQIAPKPSAPSLLGKLSLRLFGSSTSSLLSVEETESTSLKRDVEVKEVEVKREVKEVKKVDEAKESKVVLAKESKVIESKDVEAKLAKSEKKKSPPSTPAELINDDHCAACNGTGNFICCDSCPKSFHFTCAEPPLDPANLPEDDWFCSECRAASNLNAPQLLPKVSQFDALWQQMFTEITRSNPKCFVMPKRFRSSREELSNQRCEEPLPAAEKSSQTSLASVPIVSSSSKASAATQAHLVLPNATTVLTPAGIKAPSIAHLKPQRGFCHACNCLGLTRRALESDSAAATLDARHARPLLSCSLCPLYFHLDCLDPPITTMPALGQCDRWCCPVHFTKERCLALEIAEPLVTACYLLPESAIKLQFIQKRRRLLADEPDEEAESEEERLYNSKHITVPQSVKEAYE